MAEWAPCEDDEEKEKMGLQEITNSSNQCLKISPTGQLEQDMCFFCALKTLREGVLLVGMCCQAKVSN